MRANPSVFEINTFIFLRRMSEKYNRPISLSKVPVQEWRRLARMGIDLVWLMGVWQRSPAAQKEALMIQGLSREYDKALPDWTAEDVVGSPYAIYDYALDPYLGQREELADTRAILNREGLGLILDFVPNHLARDHAWIKLHPNWFVQGNQESLKHHPDWFFSSEEGIYLAHGKDPHFPPWTDTAQVNFFSTEMREALINELMPVFELANGVRCDMAMLALNSVFESTWGWALKDRPRLQAEFWPDVIKQAKQTRHDFLFIAEAYWGLERKLQEMGFDFTYDKALYDKLVSAGPVELREHLMSMAPHRSVHFIENHDEPRAISTLGRERSRAAAVVISTIPGLRLFHDGQLEGKAIRLPVQLGRETEEPPDHEMIRFYERLLLSCNAAVLHEGEWTFLNITEAWEGNESHSNLLAWSWQHQGETRIAIVNYSSHSAQGRIQLHALPANEMQVDLFDELNGVTYKRNVTELNSLGLYVDLASWSAHIFAME